VNFDQLYGQRMQELVSQQAAKKAASGAPDPGVVPAEFSTTN
jgi:hypothetical protein